MLLSNKLSIRDLLGLLVHFFFFFTKYTRSYLHILETRLYKHPHTHASYETTRHKPILRVMKQPLLRTCFFTLIEF
jgi:hypothetical protein